MKRIVFIVIAGIALHGQAQHTLVKDWDYRYGGTGNDKLSTMILTADGGMLLGGSSLSPLSGDKTQPAWSSSMDYWIVKLNGRGQKEWDKRFGGSRNEELHAVLQTADGGFLLGGYSNSGISGDKTQANWDLATTLNPTSDYWIVRTDSLGNKLWDKRFGGRYDEKLSAMVSDGAGGFLLAGYSASDAGGDKTQPTRGSSDYWVVHIDSSGNKIWDRRFGGSNNDQLYSICNVGDGGFILAGYSWSQISGDKTQSNFGAPNFCDFWIVKIDGRGNKCWDRRYGGGDNDQLYSVIACSDGGFLAGGYSWSGTGGDKTQDNWGPSYTSDFWIIKLDSGGVIQWDRDFGGTAREDEFGNMMQTADGGFLISGTSYSNAGGTKSENNSGQEQSWIIKTDAAGIRQWDKTIFTTGHDESGFCLQAADGSYLVANHTNANAGGYKSQPNRDATTLTYDYWTARFLDTTAQNWINCQASDQTICRGACIDFANLSSGYSGYQWMFDGGNPASSSSMNPQHICYDSSGTFSVMLIGSGNQIADTLVLSNYVHAASPPAAFTIVQNVNGLFAPQGFVSYQWYIQNQVIPGAANYFFVPQQDGDYKVSVTDANGCTAESVIRDVKVGIEETGINAFKFSLYPNPATSVIYVFFSQEQEHGEITLVIRNMVGEIMSVKFFYGDRTSLDVRNFAPGIYSVEAIENDQQLVRRFVRQ